MTDFALNNDPGWSNGLYVGIPIYGLAADGMGHLAPKDSDIGHNCNFSGKQGVIGADQTATNGTEWGQTVVGRGNLRSYYGDFYQPTFPTDPEPPSYVMKRTSPTHPVSRRRSPPAGSNEVEWDQEWNRNLWSAGEQRDDWVNYLNRNGNWDILHSYYFPDTGTHQDMGYAPKYDSHDYTYATMPLNLSNSYQCKRNSDFINHSFFDSSTNLSTKHSYYDLRDLNDCTMSRGNRTLKNGPNIPVYDHDTFLPDPDLYRNDPIPNYSLQQNSGIPFRCPLGQRTTNNNYCSMTHTRLGSFNLNVSMCMSMHIHPTLESPSSHPQSQYFEHVNLPQNKANPYQMDSGSSCAQVTTYAADPCGKPEMGDDWSSSNRLCTQKLEFDLCRDNGSGQREQNLTSEPNGSTIYAVPLAAPILGKDACSFHDPYYDHSRAVRDYENFLSRDSLGAEPRDLGPTSEAIVTTLTMVPMPFKESRDPARKMDEADEYYDGIVAEDLANDPCLPKVFCAYCGKPYARPSTLRTHMRTHSGERPYTCLICGKSFSQAANLAAHARTHSGERPYSCTICHRTFSQSSSVTTHMRTHSGERPYACQSCDKRFADSSTLTKHGRIHSGEKPYRCRVCSLRFSQSGNLNRHMRVHMVSNGDMGSASGYIPWGDPLVY